MYGTALNPVQIDESCFRGRRKYNRGRLLEGDLEKVAYDNLTGNRRNNYNDTIQGPWVLGIYQSATQVRFIVVPDRSASTSIPIIKTYVEVGSTIVTDEWRAYGRLNSEGSRHETVCHKENYINPETGYHTQGVERAWSDAKAWLKRARYPSRYLQSHLDEIAWRKLRSRTEGGLFIAFLSELKIHCTKGGFTPSPPQGG